MYILKVNVKLKKYNISRCQQTTGLLVTLMYKDYNKFMNDVSTYHNQYNNKVENYLIFIITNTTLYI